MAELLTHVIANGYRERAKSLAYNGMQDTGGRRELRRELQERCGVTELEAVNILNGHNIADYCVKYSLREQEAKTGAQDPPKKNWRRKRRREIY